MLDWIFAHPGAALSILLAIFPLASAICALTPTPADDLIVGKLYKLIEVIAFNVGKAKQLPGEQSVIVPSKDPRCGDTPSNPLSKWPILLVALVFFIGLTACNGLNIGSDFALGQARSDCATLSTAVLSLDSSALTAWAAANKTSKQTLTTVNAQINKAKRAVIAATQAEQSWEAAASANEETATIETNYTTLLATAKAAVAEAQKALKGQETDSTQATTQTTKTQE